MSKFSLGGLMNALIGEPRDSTGRHNNMFFLFVLAFLVMIVAFMGAIFYRTSIYIIDLRCPVASATSTTTTSKKPTRSERRRTRLVNKGSNASTRRYKVSCSDKSIYINATLQPPPTLPDAFWYVMLAVFMFLGIIYAVVRHPSTQKFGVDMVYAYKGVPRSGVESAKQTSGLQPPPTEIPQSDQH